MQFSNRLHLKLYIARANRYNDYIWNVTYLMSAFLRKRYHFTNYTKPVDMLSTSRYIKVHEQRIFHSWQSYDREKKRRETKRWSIVNKFSLGNGSFGTAVQQPTQPLDSPLLCVPHANRKSILEIVFACSHAFACWIRFVGVHVPAKTTTTV